MQSHKGHSQLCLRQIPQLETKNKDLRKQNDNAWEIRKVKLGTQVWEMRNYSFKVSAQRVKGCTASQLVTERSGPPQGSRTVSLNNLLANIVHITMHVTRIFWKVKLALSKMTQGIQGHVIA